MEVGEQGIDAAKRIAGIDEDGGFSGCGLERERLSRTMLQHSCDGGAHCDDTICLADALSGFCGELEPLGVHFVIGDVVHADRLKRAHADV